ncbi:hypothetical protein VP01_13552g1, partial [Puccinia sorghi]
RGGHGGGVVSTVKGKGEGGTQCFGSGEEEGGHGESQVALSLKELASISPMMAEELILVIRGSAGLKADGNHVSFDMQSGEVELAVEEPPGLHTDTVLCPLRYLQMCIGDCQVWAMIDSGLM